MVDSRSDRETPGAAPAPELRRRLEEALEKVGSVSAMTERLQALLQAVVSIGAHLELEEVLRRIAETAAELAGARYAALGVIADGADERLSRFVTVGIDPDEAARIGHLPEGRGVLGLLIRQPLPLRLDDLNAHPVAAGFPDNHPVMRSFLGVPISVGSEAFGNLYLTEKVGGGTFTEADEQIVLTLASAAGLAVQNARLYDRARRRQQWLGAVSSITTQLLAGVPSGEVLPEVVRQARELSDADLALLALGNDDGTLTVMAADGQGAEQVTGRDIPAASVTAGVMREGTPLAVADVRTDTRIWAGLLDDVTAGAALYVPLGKRGEALGTLVVTRLPERERFADDVLRVVESFAGQAAIALRLGTAAADREQLALLRDRDRIARDLHDLVIQRLFAVGLSLQGLSGALPPEPRERVAEAVDDLDLTIQEIRTTIFALQSPAPLSGEGVRAAVLQVTAASARVLGFDPHVLFDGPVDTVVDRVLAEQLVAVLREALSNIARHAGAQAATVSVAASADAVTLTVTDDGRGITRPKRGGLLNLGQRAAEFGGAFAVGPGPAGGTTLRWSAPLSR